VAVPVYAVVADPDSIVLYSVRVFQNIFETGDQLFVYRYDVAYDPEPDELASETFLVSILNAGGTTVLFQRPLINYQHNIISIYLDSDQAVTWGQSNVVRLQGNPGVFFPLTEGVNQITVTLSSSHWILGTASVSRPLLGAYVLRACEIIEVDEGSDLVSTEQKLTAAGAVVTENAIPGLQTVAPEIYTTAVATPDTPVEYRTSTLVGTVAGTFVADEAVVGGASEVSGTFISGSQTATEVQVLVTGVDNFEVGETASAAGSGASVAGITEVVQGSLEWEARARTGTRLDEALTNFGAWLGISRTATGGVFLFLIFAMTAGFIFASTGQVHGAIIVAFPVLILGNYLGIIPFAITWIGAVVVALVFAIIFIMGKVA